MTIFHIGLHKTATTWLQQIVFPAHRQLALVNDSTAPWNDPLMRWLVLGEGRAGDAEAALEARAGRAGIVQVVSAERLSGHPASGWHDRREIARRIAQLDPDAKILLFVRRQPDLVVSLYKQLVTQGLTEPLSWLLDAEALRIHRWKVPRFGLDGLNHAARAEHLASLFGEESIGVFWFEDLQDDPASVLRRMFGFVGVEPWVPPDEILTRRMNVKSVRGLEASRRLNRFRRSPLNPCPLLDLTPLMDSRFVSKIIGMLPASPGLTAEQADQIERRFEETNRRLAVFAR